MALDGGDDISLKDALLNQYQAILVAGALGLTLLAGTGLPLLVFAGLELLALPTIVGNKRLARALAMRKRSALLGASETPLKTDGLDVAEKKRFDELVQLAASVKRGYGTRLAEVSDPLLLEQEQKLQKILEAGLAHLKALQAYDELDKQAGLYPDLGKEIAELEAKAKDPATSDRVKEKVVDALDYKKRLAETLARSRERREGLALEYETLRTALRILAQESAALLAPAEVSARLDELVHGSEAASQTLEELESLSREGLRARAAVRAGA